MTQPQFETQPISFQDGNNFDKLIKDLKTQLDTQTILQTNDINALKLQQLMQDYISNETEWSRYALHDPTKNYSRNGVANISHNANLLILVWEPERGSAIHDHASAHCIMKILKGSLEERLYDVPQENSSQDSLQLQPSDEEKTSNFKKTMVPRSVKKLQLNGTSYISDDIGVHKMYNPNKELAVSLHLYTPPYAAMYGCSIYGESGVKYHVDKTKYHSFGGILVNEEKSHDTDKVQINKHVE